MRDVLYALRFLRRNPAFAAIAVGTLAFGIAANTAVFSMVDSLLLHNLPYPEPDRLAAIETLRPSQPGVENWTSAPDFFDFRARQRSFARVAAISPVWRLILTGRGPAQQLDALYVSADFFPLLGVRPALGRVFTAPEDRGTHAAPVAVVSYGFWQKELAGAPSALGTTLHLDGAAVTVIGVLPRDFRYTGEPLAGTPSDPAVWLPLGANEIVGTSREVRFLKVIGRLGTGVSLAVARQEVRSIGGALAAQFPASNRGFDFDARPLHDVASGKTRGTMLLLMAAVGFVLLMACGNVAGLLLARSASRGAEMHVRAALGASRGRLVRQLLFEGLAPAIAGGVAGILLADAALRLLAAAAPAELAALRAVRLDWRALAFTACAVLAAALLCGLPPALRLAATEISSGLRHAGRGITGSHARLRSSMVVLQFAAALVLLAGTALLVRSFEAVLHVDPGFDARNVVTISTQTPPEAGTAAQRAAVYQMIHDRLRAIAGVRDVAAVSRLPLMGSNLGASLLIEGQHLQTAGPYVEYRRATPNYFAVMGIPLLAGRYFDDHDTDRTHAVCVVSETTARRFWHGASPLGRRIKLGPEPETSPWITVVGIVGDVRHFGLDVEPPPQVYVSTAYSPLSAPILVIRTERAPHALVNELRAAVQSSGSEIPAYNVITMQDLMDRSTAERRFTMGVMGIFAVGALLLAAVGIYGVVSHAVAQRTQEIGLRMALGAAPRDAIRLVFTDAGRLALLGVLLGAAMAVALSRFMRRLLFEVQPSDPVALAAAAATLIAVAALACYLPARRASHVDPVTALRQP